jgi:putative NIF3 family GTP cyclohydrolase 1 type 2
VSPVLLPAPSAIAARIGSSGATLRADVMQTFVKGALSGYAIGCGAADDFVGTAADAGADALLLGEARFHACLEARARGIGLILAGHYATERFAACILADRIARKFPELSVKASDKESDPIRVV